VPCFSRDDPWTTRRFKRQRLVQAFVNGNRMPCLQGQADSGSSREDLADHVAVYVGEANVAASKTICKFLMIEP
jgi:hypothetical protein